MKQKGKCNRCCKPFVYDDNQQSGKWCSNKCQMTNQYEEYIEKWKSGEKIGGNGYEVSGHVRRYLHEKFESKCSLCGWGEINKTTGKIPLHIDHIDGDSTNHVEKNIRLICPNCHSLTPNFGSLNRGNGRYKKTGKVHPKYR